MATLPMSPQSPELPEYLVIEVLGEENIPSLQEVSSFIYDFNLLYELSRIGADPRYERYVFSRFIWTRNGRHLKEEDRLRVTALRLGSPFFLQTALKIFESPGTLAGLGAAIWAFTQAAEKIADWKPNRELKRLEVEKVKKELGIRESPKDVELKLNERGGLEYVEKTIKRISNNEIKITDIRLRIASGNNQRNP